MRFRAVLFASLCMGAAAAADLRDLCPAAPRQHVETAGPGAHDYTIRMGGRIDGEMTRDPVGYWAYDQFWEPNLYVRIENTGDVPVVDPWLRRKDRPDTRSLKSIVDFVVNPSMSDAEKARRLWQFEIGSRFHATTNDEEVDDSVKRFNCYGYTLCGNESKIMSDLWRTAGLKVRRGFPNGHSTAEVFFDGAWHLLDSDESIICLLRDNKTIASEAQIVGDHDLMKRTHTYGPLHEDNAMGDETSSALHYWEGERSGEQPALTRHTMGFTLRPGEAISWSWSAADKYHASKYEGGSTWNRRWRLGVHAMDGETVYSPDLGKPETLNYVQAGGFEQRDGPYGKGLYGRGPASLTVPVASAYPIVGGHAEIDFARGDVKSGQLTVSVSFDGGKNWKEVATSFASDYTRMYVDLNDAFPSLDPARYRYLLRIAPNARAAQGFFLKGLRLASTLQMARLAMPGVSLGENTFTYSDRSGAGARVRITHAWTECDAATVPAVSAGPMNPPDRSTASGTRVAFRWQPVPAAADYEFQLSEYPDMRWPLSPNFHKLVQRTAFRGTSSYELPYVGLLNPGQTYYWRVRARSSEGVWGPWSGAWAFSTVAPAVPVNVRARFDAASRAASLAWEPGAGGSKVVRYRIYGSAERGFTAHDKAYRYHAGLDGMRDAAANLLIETTDAANSVKLPRNRWRPWYRVMAVDAEGRESGVSELAELPHPLVTVSELPRARAGERYEAPVMVSASIGHLVSQDENGKSYQMKFRSGDDLVFELTGAPPGVSIDPKTGVITGTPGARGKHELKLKVTDRRTGASDSPPLLLVVN